MKLTGKIFAIGEKKTGLSDHIGEWEAQDYVLQFLDGDYERKLVFKVFGQSKIKEYDLHEGDEVEVFIRFGIRESKGWYFNKIEAGYVNKLKDNGQQSTDAQTGNDGERESAARVQQPLPVDEGGPADDLPF